MADENGISTRNLKPVTISSYGECKVVSVGKMEIWDGADMSLFRETMRRLIEEENCHTVGVDMKYVKYVPSGFFGMLCEWHDKGASIWLFGAMPHVQQMLWFTRFFHAIGNEIHELRPCRARKFEEPASERAQAEEPVTTGDSPLPSSEERTSSASIRANRKAQMPTSSPIL